MQTLMFPSQLQLEPMRRSSRLLALFGLLVAMSAQAQEPSISVGPGDTFLGSPVPGTEYSVQYTVVMFGLGAQVDAFALKPANRLTSVTSITPSSAWINANQQAIFTVKGVVPSVPDAWAEDIGFRYTNSSGPVTITSHIRGKAPSTGPTTRTYWVGVIPDTDTCPPGSPLLSLHMDNEDHDNENNRAGWIGATISDRNTTFRFCRVDGLQFKPLAATDVVTNHYAVLRLGNTCPNDSVSFSRWFHNQVRDNANWDESSSGDEADLGANDTDLNDALSILHFCLFKSGTNTMTEFPALGFQYGVLAASDFSKAVQTGWIYSDDEDTWGSNGNEFHGDLAGKRIVVPTGSDGRNTTIHMARATQDMRPVARCTVSPTTSGADLVFASFNNNGSFARPGRTLMSYAWRFSAGATASGPGPHTRRLGVGNHTGTLTVTDNLGEQGSATCTVQVTGCNAPVSDGTSSAGRDPCL
ncbi:hypothetical protein [Pyxidicoccus trucidator]|uniref:hypothetical protein n=1 Tax=Pyxidicoccus trucidator TaxID=2709662 RepID=UPI0013D9E1C1|nr:hypothetical protein [Pyxidicoccus trucidator]